MGCWGCACLNNSSFQVYRLCGAISICVFVATICLGDSDCSSESFCAGYAPVNGIRCITSLDCLSSGIPGLCGTISIVGKRASISLSHSDSLGGSDCAFLTSIDGVRNETSFHCVTNGILRHSGTISIVNGISAIRLSDSDR